MLEFPISPNSVMVSMQSCNTRGNSRGEQVFIDDTVHKAVGFITFTNSSKFDFVGCKPADFRLT